MTTAQLVPTSSSTDLDRSRSAQALAGAWLLELPNPNTRAAYSRDLQSFAGFLSELQQATGETAPELLEVTRQQVALYAEWLRGDLQGFEREPMASSTIARKLSALSSFYAYAVSEGLLAVSPVEKVKRPKVSDRSTTLGPDSEELVSLLEAAREVGPNALALVSLLGLVGLRVSEVVGATVGDLTEETGKLGKRHTVLEVTRKGGRRQKLALPETAAAAVAAVAGERTEGALLLRASGLPLDRYDCARLVARVAKRAGVEKRLSPHSLRHGYVTLCLESGEPLEAVQDACGHADPRTTRRYDRLRESLDRSPSYGLERYLLSA